MLGTFAARILAIAGASSAELILFLRDLRAIDRGSGYIFDLNLGIPHFVICDSYSALVVSRVTNLIEVGKA